MNNAKVQSVGRFIGFFVLYATAKKSPYFVDEGNVAIVINCQHNGVKDKVYYEGIHFVIPWFERPIIYDVRARPNLVLVNIDLEVLAHPMASQLPTIYRTLGENYKERVFSSIGHETLKDVVSQYSANELIAQPEPVVRDIRKILTERAANFNIAVDDVSFTKIDFGDGDDNPKQINCWLGD